VKKATIIGMILTLGFSSTLFAIDNVKFSGKLLYRYEMDERVWTDTTTQGNTSYLQTRLNAVFQPSYDVKVMVQLQDSRITGSEVYGDSTKPHLATLLDGSAAGFDLHQGYVQLTDLFINNLDLKLGRYEVSYGPQRLIGAVGWHFIGRSFDGFTATYHHDLVDVDFFNLKTKNVVETDDANSPEDIYLTGLYANFKFDGYTAQAFSYLDKVLDDKKRATMGVYAKGKIFGGLSHETEYALQKVGDVTSTMMGLNLTYKHGDYKISGGYDYLSGADEDKQGTFFNGYGTNHKYYGLMDQYLWTGAAKTDAGTGLIDTHFKVSGKFAGFSGKLAYHIFQNDIDTDDDGKTDLGNEIDIVLNKKYNDNVKFQFVHSTFTPDDANEESSTWFYLATIINF